MNFSAVNEKSIIPTWIDDLCSCTIITLRLNCIWHRPYILLQELTSCRYLRNLFPVIVQSFFFLSFPFYILGLMLPFMYDYSNTRVIIFLLFYHSENWLLLPYLLVWLLVDSKTTVNLQVDRLIIICDILICYLDVNHVIA